MRRATRLLCAFALLPSVAFAQSLDETRKKAESGDATAQFNLGLMYANGEGVPKDDAEAVRWYRLAADQGLAPAQFNLGLMYAIGEGVPKDLVQAHAWLNIAGASGLEEAKKALPIVEKQMNSEQKAEAMKLARETFARIEAKKK